MAVKVNVKVFASLREQIGCSEAEVTLSGGETVNDVWNSLLRDLKFPSAAPSDVLMAVNLDYVKSDAKVQDGDEVAFFPPVTGG